MRLVAVPIVVALGCFAIRRALFLAVTAIAPRRRPRAADACDPPPLTLVVPACNEAAGIDATLEAIAALDYPAERMEVVLVDDASDDATAVHLERWAAARPHARVLRRERRAGKPRAVEAGLAIAPATPLVAMCDADVRLRPDYLRRVVDVFADPTVGGAVGYLAPANALASATASYAAVESWMHQLVTSAAKDRLDLNPPTLGGAPVFRRAALEAVGGLGPVTTGDDVRVTVALTRAGWRTRFVENAVADNAVAERPRDYWRQHVRWARDLYATAAVQTTTVPRVPLGRRVEAWMLSVGYLDRLVLVAAFALAASGAVPWWIPLAYLGITAVELVWAIVRGGAGRHLGRLVLHTVGFFPIDVAATVVATIAHLTRGSNGATPAHSPARTTSDP
jgi:cellulose synthase/poly-beta-1,6-N-acetylglucosamine synthase-like glycosyltransferase